MNWLPETDLRSEWECVWWCVSIHWPCDEPVSPGCTLMLTQASMLPVLQTLQTDLEKEIRTDTPCKSAQHASTARMNEFFSGVFQQ